MCLSAPCGIRRINKFRISLDLYPRNLGALCLSCPHQANRAVTGTIPTGLGTHSMALGSVAAMILWSRSGSRYLERFNYAGRVALTNYLTQTILGLTTPGWLLADVGLTRTTV